jgi:hypothetical protein
VRPCDFCGTMVDMFYFCSPPAAVKYLGSSSKRYQRKASRPRDKMEQRVCMVRLAEPVFHSSSLLPFFPPPDRADYDEDEDEDQDEYDDPPQRENDALRRSGRPLQSVSEEATTCTSGHLPSDTDVTLSGSARSGSSTDQGLPSQHRRPQCDDILREETARRRRVALDEIAQDGPPQLDSRVDPITRSRMISHQPSCDSLQNFSVTTDERHFSSVPRSALDTEHDSMLEGISLQYGNTAQYTVLTDMAETAWSVDDPRHYSHFLDSIATTFASSAPQVQLRDTLLERARADTSTLPMVNRQESIESGVDMQGIDWSRHGASRSQALQDRASHLMPSGSSRMSTVDLPSGSDTQDERHYRFHYFNGTVRPKFAHHQLRHVLASAGREVYYTTSSKIMRASLSCPGTEDEVLDLSKSSMTSTPIRVTCLAATDSSILVAGGFDGEYALRNLDSPTSHSEGYVTHDRNGLVTHVHTFSHRRSGLPQAAFCANDQRIRIMDLATETFTKTLPYAHSLNSATTASDGRLRALVGDSPDALITDAESGESLATLRSHADHVFSCAWSPDSRFLATGAQDGKIALWDSRNWARPLATLPNVLSCSRSLHFSADSSMLVSAENEDVVSIFDTRSLSSSSHEQWQQQGRQDIRFFGTIAGVTLVDGGDEIVIANGDRSVGGLMSFRRSYHNNNTYNSHNDYNYYSPKTNCRRKAAKRRATAMRGEVVEEFWEV